MPSKKRRNPRVFISYSHDSTSHSEAVLDLADRLRSDGIDAMLDAYSPSPSVGWPRWMAEQIKDSDAIIMICTSTYYIRAMGREKRGTGRGSNWEGLLIIQSLYEADSRNLKVMPVSLAAMDTKTIPDPFRPFTYYSVSDESGYQNLYRAILGQPKHIKRPLGSLKNRDEASPVSSNSLQIGRKADAIKILSNFLKPIDDESRSRQLLSRDFCGRQWLFDAVEEWRLNTKHKSRLFWIMGGPGVGKSAFAFQLAQTRKQVVIANHFCEWDRPDHLDVRRVIRSLAFQLATRLPHYRKLLLALPEIDELDKKDTSDLFDYLLTNPLHRAGDSGQGRYIILIDALDEANDAGRNPLVDMLARDVQRLPDWLGCVATSRAEFGVTTRWQALNPFVLDVESELNRADIRAYTRSNLAPSLRDRPDADRLVELILVKSEGVFMYVEHFCEAIRLNHLTLDHPEHFPQGLGGIFNQYFRRQFPDSNEFRTKIRPVFRTILASREPLPLKIVQDLFHWQEDELRDFTRPIASLFPVTNDAGKEVIRPYHKSLPDWLTDSAKAGDYFVSRKDGHKLLAEHGLKQFNRDSNTVDDYFLAWLPSHLRELGDNGRLVDLLKDSRYLRRRLEAAFSFVDRYEYVEPQRVLDIRDAATELINTDITDLYDTNQRPIETERASLLYKCHEYLRNAGLSDEAQKALRGSLQRREQLAKSALMASDRRQHLGAMIWCHVGFVASGRSGKAKHLKRAESILREIVRLGIEDSSAADAVARLQGVVACTLAHHRPDKRIALFEEGIGAYRRAIETSPNDRTIDYSLGSAERYLAYALLESGKSQDASSHLAEAERVLARLLKYQPENVFYVRLDAHLRRIRSRLLAREGNQAAAIALMREACNRIEEACATVMNRLVHREAAEFRKELETL